MAKILVILSLISTSIFSQTITYGFSEAFETVKGHDMGLFRFNKNEYFELYLRKGDDMVFQLYDESFKNLKKQEVISLPENSRTFADEGFFKVKNDMFWLYSTSDRNSKTEQLFALPFDKSSLSFSSSEIKLVEAGRMEPGYKYRVNYSVDSTKILATYTLQPKGRRVELNKEIIGFNLYDHKMNKLYAGEIEMPYPKDDINKIDYEIDSRGNIYLLIEVKINNSIDGAVNKGKENRKATRYELFRVYQKDNTLQVININLSNKYTKSALLSEDLNHNVIISGYYSDEKNSSISNGAFIISLELDINNFVKNLKTIYSEFPAETLYAYETEQARRKKEHRGENIEVTNLRFDKIIFNTDGSMIIIGEDLFVTSHEYGDEKHGGTSFTYFYNEILVLKIDKNGKTLWCCKIPKQQSGYNTSEYSYHHHSHNGEDYFFYLDNIKNINLSLSDAPFPYLSGSGGYLSCVKMSSEGKMTKKSIIELKEKDLRIYPNAFKSISSNLIVYKLKIDKIESRVFRIDIK